MPAPDGSPPDAPTPADRDGGSCTADAGCGCGRGHRRGRARRGWVRVAVLALLAERPMHGYEMISELAERTGGAWRPSPGSVYPALQVLADEGLIAPEAAPAGPPEVGARRRYALTEGGRRLARTLQPDPWHASAAPAAPAVPLADAELRDAAQLLMAALDQALRAGSPDQKARITEAVTRVRRAVYGILAEDPGRP